MSLNTANTPDGRGVVIYNGEIILLFVREVNLSFDQYTHPEFKGKKRGNLYLTSHRIIFNNVGDPASNFKSLSMPFISLRNIKLEQPIFGANYLAGELIAQPNGGWQGETKWRLTFNRGGCIDFGQALLKSEEMVHRAARPFDAPPVYAPPEGAYYSPPPAYYWTNGNYNGYQAPTNTFPEQPPPESVFMYEQPPPYPGMGPVQPNPAPSQGMYPNVTPQYANSPYPTGPTPTAPPYPTGTANMAPYPVDPPNYNQATALPPKAHMD